ncbi:hypothetical protein M885DRAFT_509402 [Pelagophyceae sp. CCMP2097]|nr:hypothetical protein M885DRAFT_509402 [Pelagophyceae sp. CCMP2097]
MQAIRDCEALIRCVGRAFYPDDCVAVLDVLVTDKYIREDEMGPRLHMSQRQARAVMQLLEGERLVSSETLVVAPGEAQKKRELVGPGGGGADCHSDRKSQAPVAFGGQQAPKSQEVYWYVDLRKLCDVVRWRVHVMRERLQSKEKLATASLAFKCARCAMRFSNLDAVRHEFKCPERLCAQEATAKLFEESLGETAVNAIALGTKVEEQLRATSIRSQGIFELLRALEGKQLPSNKPSDNRATGVGGWLAKPADPKKEGDAAAGDAGDGRNERSGFMSSALFSRNAAGQQIAVSFDDGDAHDEKRDSGSPRKAVKAQPAFLQGSHVGGAQSRPAADEAANDGAAPVKDEARDVDDGAVTLGARGGWSTVDAPSDGAVTLGARGGWSADEPAEEPARKRPKTEPEPDASGGEAPPDEDDDEVAWE